MKTISNSQRLREKIALLLPEMAAVGAELSHHPHVRALYPEFLISTHQAMRTAVALLRTAAERCRALADADPVAAALAPYYERHAKEEDHDHWALEDLEVLGVPRAEVLRRIPSPTVASLIGAQYYWVLHHHPVSMMGDMMVREGYQPSREAVEALAARSGYPRTAFRTLERHARVDLRHRDELMEVLDGLPLREEHHTILGVSALHTVHMMIQANRELLERAPTLALQTEAYNSSAASAPCTRSTYRSTATTRC
jgi:hypothetical protein